MKVILTFLILVLGVLPCLAQEDQITATYVQNPREAAQESKTAVPYIDLKGKDLDSLRKEAEAVVDIMGENDTWTDVGPDSPYTSVVITLDGKKHTINTWYPAYRGSTKVAVVESGLVFLDNEADKEEIISKTSDRYKALTKFLDLLLDKQSEKK